MFFSLCSNEIIAIYQVAKHPVYLLVAASLRLPVPPIPSQCVSGGFLADEAVLIALCLSGNRIDN